MIESLSLRGYRRKARLLYVGAFSAAAKARRVDYAERVRRAVERVETAEGSLAAARSARDQAIVDARVKGKLTHQQIADVLGVSRQRVAQILRELGSS
jgi:DNA-directed RNA polymerase specialized sigma subunit